MATSMASVTLSSSSCVLAVCVGCFVGLIDSSQAQTMTSTPPPVSAIVTPDVMSIRPTFLCRTGQDVVFGVNVSMVPFNRSCQRLAITCLNENAEACLVKGESSGTIRCPPPLNFSSDCAVSFVLKNCRWPDDCNRSCEISNETFNQACQSQGGQLCRRTVLYFDHRIPGENYCFPGVCSPKLPAISLIRYGDIVRQQTGVQQFTPIYYDEEVTCGSGSTSVTVLRSAINEISTTSATTFFTSSSTTTSGGRSSATTGDPYLRVACLLTTMAMTVIIH